MLTYNMEDRNTMSMYAYLYTCIKNDILSGKLLYKEKLPSKRKLSEHLKISIITVENAYAQLAAEGYIFSLEKRGYFVSNINVFRNKKENNAVPFSEEENKQYFMDFTSNSIRTDCFPFTVWAHLMRQVLLEKDKKLLMAAPRNGVPELRQAICDYLYEFSAMEVSPEQIIVGAGTDYLYNLIIQLLGRDLTFALEDPGYKKISDIYEINKIAQKFIPLDNFGISISDLIESKADILHISPSHHFPTGIVTSIGRRHEILKWAEGSKKRYIIEDEYDSEFRFSGLPIPALQSIDINEKVIYINTFSKTISPSIRISYLILPRKLLNIFNNKLGFYSCTVPVFEQYTLAEFISKGYFERHLSRVKNLYRAERNKVIETIEKSELKSFVKIKEENSGLHFLLNINTKISDEEIKARAQKNGINVSFLSEYLHSYDPKFAHNMIINYSGIDDNNKLEEAVSRLYLAFTDKST